MTIERLPTPIKAPLEVKGNADVLLMWARELVQDTGINTPQAMAECLHVSEETAAWLLAILNDLAKIELSSREKT